jgi:hypothetical protein
MPTRNYSVTLTTATSLIAWYSRDRNTLEIRNDSGSDVYVSVDPQDANHKGMKLPTGTSRTWSDENGDEMNRPFYGLASAGSLAVDVEESIE